jgi:hypothetical protein
MLRRMAVVKTDVSKERFTSINRVEGFSENGTLENPFKPFYRHFMKAANTEIWIFKVYKPFFWRQPDLSRERTDSIFMIEK